MKRFRRILQSLFPSPRCAFRWPDIWPLATFLVAFAGLCVGLELAAC